MTLRRQYLSCGCCGEGFYTWPEYVNQDQDKGYGICANCQDWIGKKNDAELDSIADKIEAALNPTNAAKFRQMDNETRRLVALRAVDKGLVSFSIGART